jgi:glycosyltransferase involved in cell wall biosynthesis
MSRLAKDHKVLFVSPAFEIREVLKNLATGHLIKSGLVQREHNLYTLVPPKWLFVSYRFGIQRTMEHLRRLQIQRILKRLGFRDVVLFVWHPHYWNMLGKFRERLSCYYVDDEFASYSGTSEDEKERTLMREDYLLSHVDLVFANGSALFDRKNRYNNAINVPMGVDFNLFSRALLRETKVFDDVAAIHPPRIGYVGNVNDKVDFQLLDFIAERRPDWSIVLIGPVTIRSGHFREYFTKLKRRQNVFILGLKPKEDLPNYLKGLDVCLMCYRTEDWGRFLYPNKLHEYLASGKPVVSSDLQSVREFSGILRIAKTDEAWVDAIQNSLSDRDNGACQRGVEVARRNTWDERVIQIEKAIEKALPQKRPSSRQGAPTRR